LYELPTTRPSDLAPDRTDPTPEPYTHARFRGRIRVLGWNASSMSDLPVNRPIAAHFHSVVLEFACFGEDLGESVCELVEARACIATLQDSALRRSLPSAYQCGAQPFGEFHSRMVLFGRFAESVEADDGPGSRHVSRTRYRLFADRGCPWTFQCFK